MTAVPVLSDCARKYVHTEKTLDRSLLLLQKTSVLVTVEVTIILGI
jgi:hypothetical protein